MNRPRCLGTRALALIANTILCGLALSGLVLSGSVLAEPTFNTLSFESRVQPLLKRLCHRCHNVDNMESGVRLDTLNGDLEERHLRLWEEIQRQLVDEAMPPEDEPQPTAVERQQFVDWIEQALNTARARQTERNGSVRRLTVSQYRNTLRDLLGIEEELVDILPPDAVSRDGFTNNSQSMLLSPLQVEAYFSIAEKALDLCIVDEQSKPAIQNFRVDLGQGINPSPYPDNLILGANNHLLANGDFIVQELVADKPFEFEPFKMRTKYRFNEGYQGNSTVRGWREYDSIYHAVFACMRGNPGYPKGKAYETIPGGLLLRPAIPSAELFQVESTYGPQANFKISLRELPDHGNFRVTVRAAKYDDGLLLDPGSPVRTTEDTTFDVVDNPARIEVERTGIYQVDVILKPDAELKTKHETKKQKKQRELLLQIGERRFSGRLVQGAFLVVRLQPGTHSTVVRGSGAAVLERLSFTRLEEDTATAKRFVAFERRIPRVGVHLGLRRDCGSTLNQVEGPQEVSSLVPQAFVFEGAINNFPSPDVEEGNDNYLAGIREIGVRSEFTDGRDMPRLLIESVEFEGPLYEMWPPVSHRQIFIESSNKSDSPTYAREIIQSFAKRAFRRPVTKTEEAALLAVWNDSYTATGDFQRSMKDALLVVLTSPQFLFLIEDSKTSDSEELTEFELASKLSYFLWNSPPDSRLIELAEQGLLRERLDAQFDRMIGDERFSRFTHEFVSQWLSLEKFDVVGTDRSRFPNLTRDTKEHLRSEPIQFVEYLLRRNLPLSNLVRSEVVMANEVVANYYGLGDRTESGFSFIPIKHGRETLGGVLTQASILAGLSDGREANPVKRGAWLARKIVAEPPDDPPPNVPAIEEDDGSDLTLRQKLKRHRNQKGCVKCHEGIDPWGVPFQSYDAGGRFEKISEAETQSTLPDQTTVANVKELKEYLANDRIDQVAFSFLKHIASYAVGRSLSYNEVEFLREEGIELRSDGYLMQDMVRFVVNSDLFLKK